MRLLDPCVVETAQLSTIVIAFLEDWRATRPARTNQFGADEQLEPLTGIARLAYATGLPESTIRESARKKPRYRYTELRIADAILTEIDSSALADGTLPVVTRPSAPPGFCPACGQRRSWCDPSASVCECGCSERPVTKRERRALVSCCGGCLS